MRLVTIIAILLSSACTYGKFIAVETEQVPIARLITNLEKQLKQRPKDFELHYALARVHSMGYAMKTGEIAVKKNSDSPWFGHLDHGQPPQRISPAANSSQETEAKSHLEKAIEQYKAASELKPEHLPSQLGLGWCLDQSGDKAAALERYRKALSLAWEREKNETGFMGPSMTEEIAGYMLPLLDPKKDAEEIQKLKGYQETMTHKPRAVTPVLIPLQEHCSLGELVDPALEVPFDLDGSGLKREWGWISPKAGWLVFDPQSAGQITSGLQMVGGVAFWIFWENGYHALAALDNDNDGLLRGEELGGLAIWQDTNCNGRSEPGEVRPLNDWGIIALSYRYEKHGTGIPFSPHGVIFKDGTVRPSFDWIARSRRSSERF